MASVHPVERQVNEGQQQVTGDSFIRSHFRKLSPYQPILPFEVFYFNPTLFFFLVRIWCELVCEELVNVF